MKTIEEEAVFLSNKNVLSNINWNDTSELERLKEKYYDGFKAGVELAQRWISVEDELPEKREREYQIIAKTDNIGSAMHGIIFTKWIKDESSLKSIKNYFTHWRPIELK